MAYSIKRATVIGAGTMGAGIAVHLANTGILVQLLDIVPEEPTDKEIARGLTLEHPSVRNRIVREGLERLSKARRPIFFSPRFAERIEVGNLEDNFDWVGESDWIIEAVVENLEVKRDLMARIEKVRRSDSIVSTNTSGLLLREISAGLSSEFGNHFLGTHFFNPPAIMKLLEIIPGPLTDSTVVDFMVRFCEDRLGKGVIVCRDTPNFIANRLGAFQASFDQEYVISHGYTVEEADAILGPLIGRPKTALFRLRDLVGIDISTHVLNNLYQAIPHDRYRETLKAPQIKCVRESMVERGWLGRKSGQGFYKEVRVDGSRQFWGLDLEKLEYREPQSPNTDGLEEAQSIDKLDERLRFLVKQDNRVGQLVWASLKNILSYAAYCADEISDDYHSLDRAMCWGYSWELGPFEIWDALGVERTLKRMEAEGEQIADWVKDMLAEGMTNFYENRSGVSRYYDLKAKNYREDSLSSRNIFLANIKTANQNLIKENPGASLVDLGDGVACLEFHTKANALDDNIYEMMELSLQEVERNFIGLVIGNEGKHFCAGANIQWILEKAREGTFDEIERRLRRSQQIRMTMRYFPKPIVAACFGMTLGGGAEIAMASSQVCAAAESRIGLVETGVGLIPGGGGCKELIRRVVSPPMRNSEAEPVAFVKQIFNYISTGKVSNSAFEAMEMGFLEISDRIIMNRDRLLAQSKRLVVYMEEAGYIAPTQEKNIYVLGRKGKSILEYGTYLLKEAGQIQEHDALINQKLAHVLCGGDVTSPQWVDEEYILDLEREAFCSLCGEPKTQARIEHFLSTGQKLSN